MRLTVRKLFTFKDLLLNLVAKDISVRYQGSVGILWAMVHPLIVIVMYLIIFTCVFKPFQPHHTLYLVAGLIHWNLFNLTVTQSCKFVTGNASILTKMNFPRILVVLSGISVNFILWVLSLGVFLLLYMQLGGTFNFAMLAYPVYLALYVAFIFGVSLIAATLNVRFRDVSNLIQLILHVLFWATPIIYPLSRLPDAAGWILKVSPLTDFVLCFEAIFYQGTLPPILETVAALTWTAGALVIGLLLFSRQIPFLIERL